MIHLELFSCAGGMAEGFRRAGIPFDRAVDFAPDHCDSYEQNLGHRPVAMDVRDLLRLVRAGELRLDVDLFVADPPCTPWSRAGKRLGTADKRDMLETTCDLIAALRPRRYLIGNVPGLEDQGNLPIVQRVIGGLARHGYCKADFVQLDAADYGVAQHRIRPFWFGHREGPCVRSPAPTHGDPDALATLALPGVAALRPWVTCREALGHLPPEQLGRAVKMRKRADCGKQKGSRHDEPVHTSDVDAPARSITTQCRAPGHATTLVRNGRHLPAEMDAPAPTMGAKMRGQGAQVLSFAAESGRKKRPPSTKGPQSARTMPPDAPASTVHTCPDHRGSGSPVLEWPWPHPATTVHADARLAPPGHHDDDFAILSLPDAIVLSERAAAILQGFPESWVFVGATKKARWSQIGQAMPPALAEAVARAIVEQDERAVAMSAGAA